MKNTVLYPSRTSNRAFDETRTITSADRIVWSRDFETGIAEIDTQHLNLVKMFNKANAELREDSGRNVWERITREFHGYLLYHFWTEEELAAQYGYDVERSAEAASHFEQHRQFAESIAGLRKRIHASEQILKCDYLSLLKNWLFEHITHNDRWLVAFLLERQRQVRYS
jgi:hemerythrin